MSHISDSQAKSMIANDTRELGLCAVKSLFKDLYKLNAT